MNFVLQDLWVKFDCALCGHPRLWQLGILLKERQAHLLASHVGRTFPDASGFPLNSWLQLSTLSGLNTKNITSQSGKASFESQQQTAMYTLLVGKKSPWQLLHYLQTCMKKFCLFFIVFIKANISHIYIRSLNSTYQTLVWCRFSPLFFIF